MESHPEPTFWDDIILNNQEPLNKSPKRWNKNLQSKLS